MDMNRRNVLIGLGTAAAGSSVVFGSGAFTSVTATRDVTVSLADDDTSAALTLEPTPNSDNAEKFVEVDDDGTIGIDVSSDTLNGDADGLNPDATTIVRSLFDITNNGSQPVLVWVEDQPDGIGFFADNFDSERPDTGIGIGSQSSNAPLGGPRDGLLYLKQGESLTDVGFFGEPDGVEDDDITIQAATPDEIYFSDLGEYDDVEEYDSASDDSDFDISDLEEPDWREDG